jgi:hypothetical protein
MRGLFLIPFPTRLMDSGCTCWEHLEADRGEWYGLLVRRSQRLSRAFVEHLDPYFLAVQPVLAGLEEQACLPSTTLVGEVCQLVVDFGRKMDDPPSRLLSLKRPHTLS